MKSISCPLCCNSTFATQKDLKIHLINVISNLRCPTCCTCYSNISTLIDHLDNCFSQVSKTGNSSKKGANDSEYNKDSFVSRTLKYENCVTFKNDESSLENSNAVEKSKFTVNANQNHYNTRHKSVKVEKNVDLCNIKEEDVEDVNDNGSNKSVNGNSDNDEDEDSDKEDDVEGFYCTVCNMKIPSIEEHIQEFHTGQEVILQEDEESEESESEENSITDAKKRNCSNNAGSGATKKKLQTKKEYILSKKRKYTKRKGRPTQKNNLLERKYDEEDIDDETEETLNDKAKDDGFFCTVCALTFTSFDNHMNCYHQNQEIIIQNIEETLLLTETDNGKSRLTKFPYKCPECKSKFGTKQYLSEHLLMKHNCTTGVSNSINNNVRKRHLQLQNQLPLKHSKIFDEKSVAVEREDSHSYEYSDLIPHFECNECGKIFTYKLILIEHLKKHIEENLFICKHCKETFKSPTLFLNHKKIHFEAGSKFQCNICEKEFAYKSSLKIHLKCQHIFK